MALNLKRKRKVIEKDVSQKKRHVAKDEDSQDGFMEVDQDEPSASESGSGGSDGGDLEDEEDEEEWGGLEGTVDPGAQAHRTGTKPKKPPTGEEVRTIREATDLFRSSSFKLQIDALLPNVRPKESRKEPLDRFLLALHTCLNSIPSKSPQHPLEAARALLQDPLEGKLKGKQKSDKGKAKATSVPITVPYPLPAPTEDANWKVSFKAPTDIVLAGSWANKVSVKAKDGEPWTVDIAVEMPEDLFQEKDYMSGRFFHKRAFYLATIAKHITDSKSGLNVDAFYESRNGDPRMTTLVLRPRRDGSPTDFSKLNAHVRIIPFLPPSSPIPISRLSPHRSNFRVHEASASDEGLSENLPTPLYNTILLLSTTPKSHLLSVHALKQDIPAYGDALALLRIWANQRGYGRGTRMCVRGFEGAGAWWSSLLEMLVLGEEPVGLLKPKNKPLGKGLSSYQLFKAALDFLSRHDFVSQPVFVKSASGHRFPSDEYAAHHAATFVDCTSTVNLLAGIPETSLEMLRHDARNTLENLNGSSVSDDPFPDVFLKEHRDLPTRFDAVIRVDLASSKMRKSSVHDTLEHGSPANALFASISSYLRRALGTRIRALAILHPSSQPRPISQAQPSTPSTIYVGLIYDNANAFRLVDHGPAAADAETRAAEDFRELWGEDKAELRRFKDGSIVESVVWNVKDADERAQVPVMVVRHVLARHFAIGADAVQSWQPAYDGLLKLPQEISSVYLAAGRPAGFKSALTAFDDLVKAIKALDDQLPLAVLNVSPVSEYLRYTSVFAPVAFTQSTASVLPPCARYMPVMDTIIEFEKSARWPDDLRAIQKMKLAFFERLATALMGSVKGLTARVVVGDRIGGSQIVDQAQLDIITPLGWVFSMRIWHDREATLLDRIIEERAHLPKALQKPEEPGHAKEREDALEARAVYIRRFIHSPRHHRAIAALSHRFPGFAGTVRLVKRWLASHWLLRSHVTEEAVEIICANVFLGSRAVQEGARERETVPGSRERGFACVVELLRDWQWTDGMSVPLYGEKEVGSEASPAVVVTAGTKGVWTLSTEFDRAGHMWTAEGPDIVAAHRIRALAKATCNVLQGMESGSLDVKSLFVHPVDDYDFVVRFNPAVLPRYFQNITADSNVWSRKGKFANPTSDEAVALRPGFDPAQLFLDDLKRTYADTIKLFYDPYGGDRFGAVWDPSLKQSRPFRVLNHFSSIPVEKENENAKDRGMVVLNEPSVLDEMVRLGSGLILRT